MTECTDGFNCLTTAATSECPIITMELIGWDDSNTALDADVATYSDGYKAKLAYKLSGDFWTTLQSTTEFGIAIGRHGSEDCTAAKCTQGFFTLMGDSAIAGEIDSEMYW